MKNLEQALEELSLFDFDELRETLSQAGMADAAGLIGYLNINNPVLIIKIIDIHKKAVERDIQTAQEVYSSIIKAIEQELENKFDGKLKIVGAE